MAQRRRDTTATTHPPVLCGARSAAVSPVTRTPLPQEPPKTLKIAANLSFLRPSVGGSYIYTTSILRELSRRQEIELMLFGIDRTPDGIDPDRVELVEVPWRRAFSHFGHQPARTWSELAGSRFSTRLGSADVIWSPGNTLAAVGGRRRPVQVVTVHDLIHTTEYNPLGRFGTARRSAALRSAVKRSDRVVVPSEFTRAAVEAAFGLQAQQVVATGEGVDLDTLVPCTADVPDRFIICPSTNHSHKNHEFLFRALVSAGFNSSDKNLLLTGNRYGDPSALSRLAASSGIQPGRVTDLGLLEKHGEVLDLISRSHGVTLPSLHEGWGLPALEALALGRPVIAHAVGGVPEFAGPGLRDPGFNSLEDWSSHLETLLHDDEAWRADARSDAVRIREAFTWQRSASRLVDAFQSALDDGSRRWLG